MTRGEIAAKFDPGQVVVTVNAFDRAEEIGIGRAGLADMLNRHLEGDWGDIDANDKRANDAGLTNGDQLLSAYVTRGTKFYVITEWDRSVTTILLPSDY